MANFQKSWTSPPRETVSERINSTIKPAGPLKPRIQNAIKHIRPQIKKLDQMINSLQKRDATLFQRIVVATQKHDQNASKVLGSELAEIRKVTKVLSGARTALDRIELRLSTCSDLGDTVVTIMPTVGLMRNIQSSLGKVMPGAEREIGQMADMLGGFLTESFAGDSAFGVDSSMSAEAEDILKEAAAIAGNSTGEMFPSVPTPTQQQQQTQGIQSPTSKQNFP